MLVLEIAVSIIAAVMLLPSALLFVQVLAATGRYTRERSMLTTRPTAAVLVPAHNEALLIAESVDSLKPQLRAGDRLLVVADNCSDDTARIAAEHGAEVIERSDPIHRGKGHALDYGIRYLSRRPPAVVVIVDADCIVAQGAIDVLVSAAAAEKRPIQALDVMRSPQGADMLTHVAEFAWLVKNYVRPMGYARLGLPCHLMGTGMAFPWPMIERTSIANGKLVEDLALGLELALAGTPARFCPEALVTSFFPNRSGIGQQRVRWEHGHLSTILHDGTDLIRAGVKRRNLGLFALALDLCVPPLALLALLLFAVSVMSVAVSIISMVAWPAAIAACAFGLFITAVLIAWLRFGRGVISFVGLAYAAAYAVWKIPVYIRFVTRRQFEWVRSRRDSD